MLRLPSGLQKGFTLLEVLLVIFIIGILSGLVVFSVGAVTGRKLNSEADRLMLSLNQAMDFSLMKQQTLGWFYDPVTNDYQFLSFDYSDHNWKLLEQQQFAHHLLATNISIEISDPTDESMQKVDADSDVEIPDIVFFSSGEFSPFTVTLKTDSRALKIKGDGFNSIYKFQTL